MKLSRLLVLVVLAMGLVACGSSADGGGFETLPEGDASRGEALYTESINGAPTCSSCHSLGEEQLVGPGFAGYGDIAGTRVEGQSAEEYTYIAIVRPARHLVEGYTNLMYAEYGSRLTDQDTADLIAFLLTQ